MLNNISIRIKIILAQILLIAIISLFIYTYYPSQQKQLAIQGVESKIRSISNMFSIGVGIGMGETDLVAVSEALNWAHTDSSVVYISVVNINNQHIASLDNEKLKVPLEVLAATDNDQIYKNNEIIFYKTNIIYQNQSFGKLIIGYSLKKLDKDIDRLKTTTLYFCLALFTAGVLLSIIIGNMITSNIMELFNAVKAISEGAEGTRVKVVGNDDISKLGKAFNQMLDTLDSSRNELVRHSDQLKKQNDELNQFSYVVSHDLKAPLRAIFKLSQWIEEDLSAVMTEETKENMEILRGRVLRLESLINGLLEYSKIGRTNIIPEKTDVKLLLKEIIDLLSPPSHFAIHIQPDMPVFNTKKILLQQVFINLISNAIKYNDKPSAMVSIKVKEVGNFYQFTVEDNGIGISPAYHEKVFIIFQTLEARDKVEGTGIGLSIVKKSVEDVGGVISLESEPGKGAKFTFTWPKGDTDLIQSKKHISNIKELK